jgi:hypothetical protein
VELGSKRLMFRVALHPVLHIVLYYFHSMFVFYCIVLTAFLFFLHLCTAGYTCFCFFCIVTGSCKIVMLNLCVLVGYPIRLHAHCLVHKLAVPLDFSITVNITD